MKSPRRRVLRDDDEEDRSMEELSDSIASFDAESLLTTLVCSSRLDSMNPPWKRKARASEITTVLSSSENHLALSDLFLSIAKAAPSSDEIGAMIYAPALSVANFLASFHDEKDSSKAQKQEIYSILDQKLSTIRRKEEVFILTKLVDRKLRQEFLRLFEKKLLSNPEIVCRISIQFSVIAAGH